jgi:hypothetical protein
VGSKLRLIANATDDKELKSVLLTYSVNDGEEKTVGMGQSGGSFAYDITGLDSPGTIQYSISAIDGWENESDPVRGNVKIVAKKSGGLWKWIGIGAAAVVASATGGYFLFLGPSDETDGDDNGNGDQNGTTEWPGDFPPFPE